jgi:hypothetical protein
MVALSESFGAWHVIYVRLNRWAKNGGLEWVCAALPGEGLQSISVRSYISNAMRSSVFPPHQGFQGRLHALRQAGYDVYGFYSFSLLFVSLCVA